MVCEILVSNSMPVTLLSITDDTVLPICAQTVTFLQSAFGAVLLYPVKTGLGKPGLSPVIFRW